MNSLTTSGLAKSVTFDEDNMWVELTDGRKLGVPLVYFPKLMNAPTGDRENYVISGGGVGIHWDTLDEDISVEGLLLGIGDRTKPTAEAA